MRPGSISKGIGTGVFLTLGGIGLGFALVLVWPMPGAAILFGIGVVQLLWMVPAYVFYRRRGEGETAKGLLIAAGLVFLLNATCWGLLMSGSRPPFRPR